MEKGAMQVYFGNPEQVTAALLGKAVETAEQNKKTIIIEFLKCNSSGEDSILKRLEPELKIFNFEKKGSCFKDLAPQEREEALLNIQNGVNFAKKVLQTCECDVLILDNILELHDYDILSLEDFIKIITSKEDSMELIITGRRCPKALYPYMDRFVEIKASSLESI